MKKILILFCICLMIAAVPAQAAETGGLEAEVTATRLTQEWNGKTSAEYDWFVVDLKLTNWEFDSRKIADHLSGKLVFRETYVIDAEPAFDEDTIAPLVEK